MSLLQYTKGIDLESLLAKLKEVHDTAKREALKKLREGEKKEQWQIQKSSQKQLEDFFDVLFSEFLQAFFDK